jgi:hypothetical protein
MNQPFLSIQHLQSTIYIFLILVQFLILNQVAINTQLIQEYFQPDNIVMEWTTIEDQQLAKLIMDLPITDIARLYKRSETDINNRIINLGLINKLIFKPEKQRCSGGFNLTADKRWDVITDVVADFVVDLVDKVKNK